MNDKEKIRRLLIALEPFVRMHREGSVPDEVACAKGAASDRTIICSGDFQYAAETMAEVNPALYGKLVMK